MESRAAKKQKRDDLSVILDLSQELLVKPPSRWDHHDLAVYRFRRGPESAFLPTFHDVHRNSCPVCGDQGGSAQRAGVDISQVQSLIGETPGNLCERTEGELLRLPMGFFWAALARAARHESIESVTENEYLQRERATVQREGYVLSGTAIPESPSPLSSSSSEFDDDTRDFDDDENEARRGKPEEVTVHIVTSFLQSALGLCLLQHPARGTIKTEVRPRVGHLRSTVRCANILSRCANMPARCASIPAR